VEGSRGRPVRTGRIAGKDLGDEYVFYDRSGDRVHVLNATARAVYLLCDGTRSVEEIAGEITAEYDVDGDTALRDVRETVRQLVELGLVALAP